MITAAVELNKSAGFDKLRVFGLLTDLTKGYFYSYEPTEKRFFKDGGFSLANRRDVFLSEMIEGMYE